MSLSIIKLCSPTVFLTLALCLIPPHKILCFLSHWRRKMKQKFIRFFLTSGAYGVSFSYIVLLIASCQEADHPPSHTRERTISKILLQMEIVLFNPGPPFVFPFSLVSFILSPQVFNAQNKRQNLPSPSRD